MKRIKTRIFLIGLYKNAQLVMTCHARAREDDLRTRLVHKTCFAQQLVNKMHTCHNLVSQLVTFCHQFVLLYTTSCNLKHKFVNLLQFCHLSHTNRLLKTCVHKSMTVKTRYFSRDNMKMARNSRVRPQ